MSTCSEKPADRQSYWSSTEFTSEIVQKIKKQGLMMNFCAEYTTTIEIYQVESLSCMQGINFLRI